MDDRPVRYPGFWIDRTAKVALPLLAGLVSWFLPMLFQGGWPHGGMADFDIYVEGARTAWAGGQLYRTGPDAFVYPPVAALLFLPFTVGPLIVWKLLWALAGWVGIIAIVHRFGLRSWPASVVAAACITTATPVTLGTDLGQIELILTCLVILDLVPGPRLFGRKLLPVPDGWLVGLMTAIKLTPGLFIVHLLINRRWKQAITASVSAAVLTAIGFLAYPQLSIFYWKRLLVTRSVGFESDPVYIDNQSFQGAALRLFKLSSLGSEVGTLLSLVTIVVGLAAAWVLLRRGHEAPAVAVIGIATALASPVSWTHHFVWIVPLAVALATHYPTRPVGFSGAVFVLWVWIAPYRVLKGGGMLELAYTRPEAILSAITPVLGLLLLIASLFAGFRRRAAPRRGESTDAQPGRAELAGQT
ncbi:glycosyltransferase family 87 protein [Raineyella sp. LH-20]|uniref:glycosyltransferase family 87 protein n=1 Tax=Raineyella sp. LH-20 TaxID=3081204 RepID=UPI002954BCFF|nr:glycosyltransferase family 87 protein [Raineyella sp. LH-20]WOP17223.1 glycosyltransferase family 87 protein [Raineyella sp. LH-20]